MPDNNKDSQATPGAVIDRAQSCRTVELPGVSSQRRKLIKASAAALPAVMTLRSGAAAATSSFFHRCLDANATVDTASLEKLRTMPPADEIVYVIGKPAKIVTISTTNRGGQTQTKYFYCLKNNSTSIGDWNNPLPGNWDWYKQDGTQQDFSVLNNKYTEQVVTTAFANASNIFCIYFSNPVPGWRYFLDDGTGTEVTSSVCSQILPSLPCNWESLLQTHDAVVYLLAYYNPETREITCHPLPQDYNAVAFTASCLTSVDPAIQI